MKNLNLLFIVCLFIVSCNNGTNNNSKNNDNSIQLSKDEIAKNLIRNSLFANLNDSTSYQPISFSKLTPTEIYFNFTENYLTLSDSLIAIGKSNVLDSLEKEYSKTKHPGFLMGHSLRAKNKMGGFQKYEYNFVFDSALTKIIYQTF